MSGGPRARPAGLSAEPEAPAGGTRAIILAGGRGTRLAPFTSVLPKPLMPVGNRAILEIVLEQLEQCGFTDVTLSVGYLSHLIRAVLSNRHLEAVGGSSGLRIDYVQEDSPLGTAGPLRLVESLTDTFLVMNGDLLTDLDFALLVERHRASGAKLTVATHLRTTKMDYGVLRVEPGDAPARRVLGYEEKPEFVSAVSMGIYVLEPEVLSFVPAGEAFDFPDLVHALLNAGDDVYSVDYDGLWFDIGRHEDYERAVAAWDSSAHLFLDGRSSTSHVRRSAAG